MRLHTITRRLAIALALATVVAIAAPAAGAKECGAQIIDQYFNTGKLAEYHSQDCYASALRQVDPDARMYSGIMGAIRAARARDRAADSKPPDKEPKTAPTADADSPTPTPTPTPAAVAPEAVPVQGEEAAELPTPENDSLQRELRRIDLGATSVAEQAASPLPAVESHTPLIVVMLGALALLLLLVGVGGVTARWLDRSP